MSDNPLREDPAHLKRWFVPRLLKWYNHHRRDLPWRRDRDPYRIWVSEVMLQQTQVATVIPYFERFLTRFPTLADLASAEEQEVLRLWEGLGYYRRARDLHRAARLLLTHHAGQFPADPASLKSIPGLGQYTRNAVLSQAFDLRLPILEANSTRVLSRVFGLETDPQQTQARRCLWQAAETLLPEHGAGEFNQALMELGALICTSASPRCDDCPLASRCVARRSGRQNEIPVRTPRPATTFLWEACVCIRQDQRVLLAQRPAAGRWANLWEFPHSEVAKEESPEQTACRLIRDLTGVDAQLGPEIVTLKHGVTRYSITLVCFEAEYRGGAFRSDFYVQANWVEPANLGDFPVSSPQRRLARLLADQGWQRRLF